MNRIFYANIVAAVVTATLVSTAFQSYLQRTHMSNLSGGTATPTIETPIITDKSKYAHEVLGASAADGNQDTNYILYRYGRMEKIEKGLLLAPDVPLPPCDGTVRGLLWFVKSDKGDGLLICVITADGQSVWRSI